MVVRPWTRLFLAGWLASGVWVFAQREVPTVFLTGHAIHEDGRPVSYTIPIELVCEGKIVEQTYPSLKGAFSFELGERKAQSNWMDSSVSDTAGVPGQDSTPAKFGQIRGTAVFGVDLSNCEIRIPPRQGYVSNSIQLTRRSAFDDSDVGLIVVRRPGHQGGTVVSVTTAAAPEKARKSFEKAGEELAKKDVNHSKIAKELERAVDLYPKFAEAWNLLGQTRLLAGDRDGARAAFRQAILADDRFLRPYVNLAHLEFQDKNWEEVSALTDQLFKLSPETPEVYYYGGLAKYSSGRIEDAEKLLRWLETKGLLERYPLAYFYLGVIDSKQGQIKLAARELRLFLKFAPEAQVPPEWRKQINQQLASWQEQGLIEEE